MNLKKLAGALKSGGFTYSLNHGDMAGSPYYAIAYRKDQEFKTHTNWKESALGDIIVDFINKNSELLAMGDMAVGGWPDGGFYYLDITELIPKSEVSLARAISLGRERQQLAIFDLETMKTIQL